MTRCLVTQRDHFIPQAPFGQHTLPELQTYQFLVQQYHDNLPNTNTIQAFGKVVGSAVHVNPDLFQPSEYYSSLWRWKEATLQKPTPSPSLSLHQKDNQQACFSCRVCSECVIVITITWTCTEEAGCKQYTPRHWNEWTNAVQQYTVIRTIKSQITVSTVIFVALKDCQFRRWPSSRVSTPCRIFFFSGFTEKITRWASEKFMAAGSCNNTVTHTE